MNDAPDTKENRESVWNSVARVACVTLLLALVVFVAIGVVIARITAEVRP